MSVTVKDLERDFIYKKSGKEIKLEDPNINLTPEQVKEIYSSQYPDLVNAKIKDMGLLNMKMTYEFESIAGTKG